MAADSKEFKCPFCGSLLEPPVEIKSGFEVFEGGKCSCGAVYVYDRTGRKLGEALTEALVFAHDGDYDKAFTSDEDYEEAVIRHNQRLNRFLEGDGGRLDRSPKFYFLRLKGAQKDS